MRSGRKAITAVLAVACAGTAACGGGGSDTTVITTRAAFPQGFLPVLFASSNGSGDVAIRTEGDLYAVDGLTPDVTAVSHVDGDVSTFANDVGGSGNALVSIAVGFGDDTRLFAGDDAGRIWAIATDGAATLFVDTGTNQPITGLAFAPVGFGDFGGQLFAAAGTAGVLHIDAVPAAVPLSNPLGNYVDLAFSGTTLFALDATDDEIDTVASSGATASFQGGFDTPVGMAVDGIASEIYVADAGADLLYTVPVAGGAPTARATYEFDVDAPSGIATDPIGAIAFVTRDPPAIRGSTLARIDPANTNFGLVFSGPNVGYGDLELDRSGAFLVAANSEDSSGDPANNFLFSISRDASSGEAIASGIGSPLEVLLGMAVDPVQQLIYLSTGRGNVYRRAPDGTGATATSPPFVNVTSVPLLGLELAPAGFAGFGGWLIATTAIDAGTGRIFAIDPESPTPPVQITLSQTVANLSDLVFSTDGVLYVVDNDTSTSRILRIAVAGTNGTVTVLAPPSVQLGRADGIEIDEGGNRLLVTSEVGNQGGGQLLAVDRTSGAVTALANIQIPTGFFPTGVVYDRLGTAVVRERENATSIRAHSVAP